MKRRRCRLSRDKLFLVEQFVNLKPAERLRYAFGMVNWALRINPNLLLNHQRLTEADRGRWRK